jgi:glycerol-3-phosphate acyltransferase PlsY
VEFVSYIVAAVLAYLLGSIPTGYLVALAKGVDIRTVGSGNIGATNVFRTLGQRAGIFVLVIDGLKGYAACAWVSDLLMNWFASARPDEDYLRISSGLFAIVGHNFTCWLYFKGGKGIATTAGVLAALFWPVFLTALSTWIVIFAVSRYVSLGSIAAAASLPVAAVIFKYPPAMITVAAAMGGLALWKHKPNIARLINGTESRMSFKKSPEPPK